MARKRKKKKRADSNLEDVLSGKVTVSALELVRLIHKINPTDKKLTESKRTRQYRIKGQLQSLLIRKYGDSLKVERPDPEKSQLISIRLKHFSEDACHAMLYELDDEAAAWARLRIDEELSGERGNLISESTHAIDGANLSAGSRFEVENGNRGAAIGAPGKKRKESFTGEFSAEESFTEELSTDTLLELGQRALERYDYEAAENFFYRAFLTVPDNLKVALNLFEFLLDYLAAYEKVVAYTKDLSKDLQKSEPVRIIRARALARCGDIDSAIKCLGSSNHPDTAKVYLLAGNYFLQRGDLKSAGLHLDILQSFTEPEIKLEVDRLIDDIHKLKCEQLAPLEKEMLEAQQQGECERAVQLARELLAELPENKNARQICHNFAAEQKMLEKARLLRDLEDVVKMEDFAREIELLKKISLLDPDTETYAQQMVKAQEKVKLEAAKKLRESKISKVLKLLEQDLEVEALEHYAALERELRQELRAEVDNSRFRLIELIIEAQPKLKPVKIVAAVLEFERCREILVQEGDPESALQLLQKNDKILRFLPEVHNLRRQAEKEWQKLRNSQARKLLDRVSLQMAEEDLPAARKTIEQIVTEDLLPDDRKLCRNLRQKLKQSEESKRLKLAYADADRANDHLKARDLANDLLLKNPDDASLWRERVVRHRESLNREWSLMECDLEDLPLAYSLASRRFRDKNFYRVIMADQDSLVTVLSYGKWLIVGILSLNRRSYRKAILMKTPEEFSYPVVTLVDSRLWIYGCNGNIMKLVLNPCEILFWQKSDNFVGEDDLVEDVCLFPQSGYLWLETRPSGGRKSSISHIINLNNSRFERQLKLSSLAIEIPRGEGFQVLAPSSVYNWEAQIIQVYSEQGRNLAELPSIGFGKVVYAATSHPDGCGYILLSHLNQDLDFDQEVENEESFQLVMEILPGGRKAWTSINIENVDGEMHHAIFSLPQAGLVFVYCSDNRRDKEIEPGFKAGAYQLLAFRISGERCERLYQARVPAELAFVTDENHSRIMALDFNLNRNIGMSVDAVELGENPPEFSSHTNDFQVFGEELPTFYDISAACGAYTGQDAADLFALIKSLSSSSPIQIAARIEACKADKNRSPEKVITLIEALKELTFFKQAFQLEDWFKTEYRDHPRTIVDKAAKFVEKGEWQEVASSLENVAVTDLDDGTARHICHLKGMALLGLGRVTEALSTLEQGLMFEDGDCELEPLIDYIKAEPVQFCPGLAAKIRRDGCSDLEVYRYVDEKLRRQEWLAVIEIMENYNIEKLFDLQILARLSSAYLAYEIDQQNERWFAKFMVLANFSDRYKDKMFSKNQLLPPPLENWSAARMQEVVDRAELWLDAIPPKKIENLSG